MAGNCPLSGSGSAGLVPSKTTHTPKRETEHFRGFRDREGAPVWGGRLDVRRSRMARMRKNVLNAARLLDLDAQRGGRRMRRLFLTLTYRPGADYAPGHLEACMTAIRNWCGRQGECFRFVRVGELTRAGVPHHHIMVWLPARLMLPRLDSRGWWPHGMTKIETARSPIGYLAKYASKGDDGMHAFPRGFRVSSVGGLDDAARREMRWWRAPKDARKALGTSADLRKVPGGYSDACTGLFWRSPWRVGWLTDADTGNPVLHVWRLLVDGETLAQG